MAVVITMLRNKVATGRWIPLAVGLAFVAGIISMTTGPAVEASLAQGIALGILANLALLARVTAIRHLVLRMMP